MRRLLTLSIFGLMVLAAAGPAIAQVAHAAAPLVIVVAVAIVLVRTAWYFTQRW